MAIRSIAQLKAWFQRGKYPTEAQFADWIDSFFHKEEDKVPISSVEGLSEQLNSKYDAAQAQELQKQVEIAASRAEANQKDIDALYTNIEELEAEDERLDGRITSGDQATLQSANTYTDTAIAEERVVRESAERTTLESAKIYADQKIAEVVGGSPEALDTLQELAGALGDDPNFAATVAGQIGKKVDKVEGKGLSTEDYTTADKSKLAGIAAGANNYVHPVSHSADMIEQNENRRFVSDAEKAAWNSKAESSHSVSYAELVALRDGKQLRPGHHYRITDFVTTVANDAEARSAGHPFDIILLATDAGTLSEEARAIVNESNAEYFATANLAAWKVWYCLDNDASRFQWADETNGRGVIYRLIDEWQNDCPYDFKNVQFKRYAITEITSTKMTADALNYLKSIYCYDKNGGKCFATKDVYGSWIPQNSNGASYQIDDNTFEWYYTFNGLSSEDGATINNNYDMSSHHFKLTNECLQFLIEDDCGANSEDECRDNIIKQACWEYDQDGEYYKGRIVLNNIVFLNGLFYCYRNADEAYWDYNSGQCYGNVFGVECKNSTFANNCFGNSFGNSCYNNTFGNDCNNNTFGNNCYYNTFGNSCYNNTFGNSCSSNTFADSCNHNTFGNSCYNNTFGNDCNNNTFGNNCYYNTFGNSCYNNTFGNNCWSNTFADGCNYNTFGNDCNNNTFGNNCGYITLGNYLRYLTVNDSVQYVIIVGGASFSSYVQNAQILNGTSGSNSSNRLQISFKANVKYCQFAAKNSSGILKVWTPADLV